VTHKFAKFLFLAATSAAISTLPLGAVTLQSLINGGSFLDNGIEFSDFTYSVSCSTGASLSACEGNSQISGIDPHDINITPDATGSPAGWQLTGGPEVISNGTTATTLDITLTYDAQVVGSNLIGDVFLGADTVINPAGGIPPIVTVGETVDNLNGGAFLGNLQVTDPPPVLSDEINISPVSGVFVTKDIDLNSGAGTDYYANVTTINQQLSQVPEPRAYAAVLGLFFALFFVIKRRREQTA
jgi:hypothetical protein